MPLGGRVRGGAALNKVVLEEKVKEETEGPGLGAVVEAAAAAALHHILSHSRSLYGEEVAKTRVIQAHLLVVDVFILR